MTNTSVKIAQITKNELSNTHFFVRLSFRNFQMIKWRQRREHSGGEPAVAKEPDVATHNVQM